MKSPVKLRVMCFLPDGEPHSEIDLATVAGFTKVATIRKWIESFQSAKFIGRYRSKSSAGYECRIITTRETVLKIYLSGVPFAPSGNPPGPVVLLSVHAAICSPSRGSPRGYRRTVSGMAGSPQYPARDLIPPEYHNNFQASNNTL
jgi:hypothetical protein